MPNPLISVIIPVYNAERTIQKCLNSVLNQSFTNYELLIIDDGSTDETKSIIKSHFDYDCRIRYFYKANGGVGSARNLGIDKADGEWIVFVDADDYLDRVYLESMLPIENEVDLVVSGHKSIDRDGVYSLSSILNHAPERDGYIYDFKEIYNYTNMYLWCGPISKLYSTIIIRNNSIRFPENMSFGEDSVFVATYLRYVKRVKFVEGYFYNVVSNSSSLTANIKTEDLYPAYRLIHKLTLMFCDIHGISNISSQESYYMDRLLFCSSQMRSTSSADSFLKDRIACYKYIYESPYKRLINNQLPLGFNLFGKLNLWKLYEVLIGLKMK